MRERSWEDFFTWWVESTLRVMRPTLILSMTLTLSITVTFIHAECQVFRTVRGVHLVPKRNIYIEGLEETRVVRDSTGLTRFCWELTTPAICQSVKDAEGSICPLHELLDMVVEEMLGMMRSSEMLQKPERR